MSFPSISLLLSSHCCFSLIPAATSLLLPSGSPASMSFLSCIYNPQITITPISSSSASFNGNRVKNHPKHFHMYLAVAAAAHFCLIHTSFSLLRPSHFCFQLTSTSISLLFPSHFCSHLTPASISLLFPSRFCFHLTPVSISLFPSRPISSHFCFHLLFRPRFCCHLIPTSTSLPLPSHSCCHLTPASLLQSHTFISLRLPLPSHSPFHLNPAAISYCHSTSATLILLLPCHPCYHLLLPCHTCCHLSLPSHFCHHLLHPSLPCY